MKSSIFSMTISHRRDYRFRVRVRAKGDGAFRVSEPRAVATGSLSQLGKNRPISYRGSNNGESYDPVATARGSDTVRLERLLKAVFPMYRDSATHSKLHHNPLRTMSCSRIKPTHNRSPSTTGRTLICEGRSSIRRSASNANVS